MSKDLIKRLRNIEFNFCREAADEIERLQADNERLQEKVKRLDCLLHHIGLQSSSELFWLICRERKL